MKHSLEIALLLSALAAVACKGDDDEDTESTASNLMPMVPGALGKANRPDTPASARIDRAGRPAISAALISTFTPDDQLADLDRYNKSGNANRAFVPIMEKSLAILDGLDQRCGNQLLAGLDPNQRRYQALATALDDDQLYVQSDREGSTGIYLGVEAEALGAVELGQGSGGGRIPGDDVVERSYSVLVAGRLTGIDDGVEEDDATHDIDVFPFLAAPQD